MATPQSPSQSASASKRQRTTRTYVACVSCRARKVKCILTDSPPCAKCHREHRECVFDTHRTSAKHRNPPKFARNHGMREPDGNRCQSGDIAMPDHQGTSVNNMMSDQDSPQERRAGDTDQPLTGNFPTISEQLISFVVSDSADALDTLSHAAQSADTGPTAASPRYHDPTKITRPYSGMGLAMTSLSEADDKVLDVWDKCRFVRQGWFTAQEAVTFIDLFFAYMAPLSSVEIGQFREHAGHTALVQDEPMLCCTLLLIASRVFTLPGAGGISRTQNIHHRLWLYCELLLKRVLLGQEKHSTAKLRTIGTIESFLLLSDWHPRAIHFPPETEGWDAFLVSPAYDPINRRRRGDEAPVIRWREDVFEPAKRADRMSWMLLGLATNLGHELDVLSIAPGEVKQSSLIQQPSVRLGYPNVLPDALTRMEPSESSFNGRESSNRSRASHLRLCAKLVQLARTARAMFFRRTSEGKIKIMSGQYDVLLQHFDESLSNWQTDFATKSQDISQPLKLSLLIDYYHLRAFAGSIAVQAVVERSSADNAHSARGIDGKSFSDFITSFDAESIRTVIQASQSGLEIASTAPFTDWLPYTPTRTRMLIISLSVFLLKATVIGGKDVDARTAISTLDRCQMALKSNCLDDIDFASQYADLVRKYTVHLRETISTNLPQENDISTAHTIEMLRNGFAWPNGVQESSRQGDPSDVTVPFDDNGPQNGRNMGSDADFIPQQWSGAADSSMRFLDTGWDSVAFGFDADSLDFLWAPSEQDMVNMATDYPVWP